MTGRLHNADLPENMQIQQTQIPIIGNIRIGEKAVSGAGKEYPTSLDYFKATGKYAPYFHTVYGDRPQSVQIIFPSNEPHECCGVSITFRDNAGRLLAEGDGKNWRVWSFKRQEYVFGESTFEKIQTTHPDGRVKMELTMRFILPKVRDVFGVWKFVSAGQRSTIPMITNVFDDVLANVGYVQNIPFELVVEKVQSTKPGSASVFPVVKMVPVLSHENLVMLAEFHDAGQHIRGLITSDKIAQIQYDAQKVISAPAQLLPRDLNSHGEKEQG